MTRITSEPNIDLNGVLIATPLLAGTLHHATAASIMEAAEYGAKHIILSGCSDIALARNLILKAALAREDWTCLLWVDGDISFTAEAAHRVCRQSDLTGAAVSAVYGTDNGHVAATRAPAWGPDRWLTGLGFLAVQRRHIWRLSKEFAPVTAMNGELIHPVFESLAIDGQWSSEDYTFCRRLGGVLLCPVGVDHHKIRTIRPDAATLAQANAALETD